MPKDLDPRVAELEELLIKARSKAHAFALAKSKDGVVLKADPKLPVEQMIKKCKADGGQAPFMVTGTLSSSGKLFIFTLDSPDLPRSLPMAVKQFFMDIKFKCKAEFILPGGEAVGEEGEGDEAESGEAPAEGDGESATTSGEGSDKPADGPTGPGPDAQLLTDRLKAIQPQLKDLAQTGSELAEKLTKLFQAAVGELKAGGLDKARTVIEAMEKALTQQGDGSKSASGGKEDDVRSRLLGEFDKLKTDIRTLIAQAEDPVGKKATQLVKLFGETIKSDLGKAAQALQVLKSHLSTELGKLTASETPEPEPQEGEGLGDMIREAIMEGVEKVEEVAQEVKDKALETARTVRDSLRPSDDKKDLAVLMALGMTWDEADKLISEKEDDDEAVEKVLKKRMDESGVPEDRREDLLAAAQANPKAFAAAMETLDAMDKDGAVRISPDAMQDIREKLEAARKEFEKAEKALADAEKDLAAKLKGVGDAGAKTKSAREAAEKAADDLKVFKARMGDTSKLSDKDKLALGNDARKLMSANETAKKALEDAIEAEKQASMDYAKSSEDREKAEKNLDKEKGPMDEARKAAEKKEGKKALLDALAYGPLSPSQKKLSDEDKEAFVKAFGKDPVVAEKAMAIALNAPNPSAVAKNVGMVGGKAEDGFADKDGNKLDLPIEERRAMAENALRMGGMIGEDYFKGFEEYLKSGKQLDPDPFGSLDKPLDDPKKEALRKKDIAVKRTAAMGEAVLGKDGQVDFSSDKAKDAMDQMMFHPGSLKVATPMVNAKMAETQKLFEDPGTKAKAQGIIDKSKVAKPPAAGAVASQDLIARTVGKPADKVTDADSKAAVLSAMMTPLSQGPVGSCFATAQVRDIRENDPLRAMDYYSKIATTGQFTAADGMVYPANRGAPQGENPLMRSFEYSVATVTEEQQSGARRKDLNKALLPTGNPPKGLSKLKTVPGLAGKWADGAPDGEGKIPEGMQTKLRKAIANDLKFEYAADLDTPKVGGGGDGHSTNGVYQIKYKGKVIDSEATFKEVMKEIALGAAGEAADTVTGQAIVTEVTSPAFVTGVLDSYGPAPTSGTRKSPWSQGGGAFPSGTKNALEGSPSVDAEFTPANNNTPRGERNKQVLKNMIGQHATLPDKFGALWTSGKGADHVFNALPTHPSADKLKGGNIDEKMEKELLKPGRDIAATKLPKEQARKLFEDQLQAKMADCPGDERDLIIAALKKAPTTEMTPKEVADKVSLELAAWNDAAAQRRLDVWFEQNNKDLKAKGQPELAPNQKQGYLQWFKDNNKKQIEEATANALSNAIETPEVVIADTNWGGSDSQIYFVMKPDPMTGDLAMYKKDAVTGKLTPAGDGWSDAKYRTVK